MSKSSTADYLAKARTWFSDQGWQPFAFQEEAWRAHLEGKHGLVNAPTGSGKTYALFVPIVLDFLRQQEAGTTPKGLQALWITPIRALTKDIRNAGQRLADELGLEWQVAIRTGDTSSSDRQKQKRKPPQVLITTPESLHLLLATKDHQQYFRNLRTIVVDEWHELIGSKRGVQMELAMGYLKAQLPHLRTWGISATIGNMDEALEVLFGDDLRSNKFTVVKAEIKKELEVKTVLPDAIEKFPWAGHMGLTMVEKVIPIIRASKSSLVFTNTRAQSEIWYQRILEVAPDLAGAMAMHHGSISRELRDWVENALHDELLKVVVCTSSLDLGVDFRPVETIIQIGSPKGVARFVQRAGRSGHQPGATSKIYFVPTHSLELLEAAALKEAVQTGELESRVPYFRSFDVLLQFMMTLAVGGGFRPKELLPILRATFSYQTLTEKEWQWCLDFLVHGGESLDAYDEYHKVTIEDGVYLVDNKRIALRHRLSIGTITSDSMLSVRFVSGGQIGHVEEWFVSQLAPGDTFWFAGRSLELVRIKEMVVQVRKSKKKTGKVPSFMGGRMSFSSNLTKLLRQKLDEIARGQIHDIELKTLAPLLEVQADRSCIPLDHEFLIESFKSREGYHCVFYPLEGHYVHEGMGALIAYRIAQLKPISFSIAKNDYGFELLSDVEIPIDEAIENGLFSAENLSADIHASINDTEMAKRRFRDMASIAGLVFKGYPGRQKKDRHLQSSSQLFFQVFSEYEPDNLLLLQAHEEVRTLLLEEARLRQALERIRNQKIVISRPLKATPFSFPIMVDRLRGKLSSEKLEDRIAKMKRSLEMS